MDNNWQPNPGQQVNYVCIRKSLESELFTQRLQKYNTKMVIVTVIYIRKKYSNLFDVIPNTTRQ